MYIGRFAPTPSGPMHFGSLLAAVASYLDAKAHSGRWLVRIEDLDSHRCPPGCASDILRTLEQFGLCWDGTVFYQSQRAEMYRAALDKLSQNNLVYSCVCSRKDIAAASMAGHSQGIYPGTCRYQATVMTKKQNALRLKTNPSTIEFIDRIQGPQSFSVSTQVGDYVLFRADGFFAYHLAVVVDDAEQKVTHVLRGADLLSSTPHHIYLQNQLSFLTPDYAHIPVVVNAQGEKLSKQTMAPSLDFLQPVEVLRRALIFLGQTIPQADTVDALLQQAAKNWNLASIPRVLSRFEC